MPSIKFETSVVLSKEAEEKLALEIATLAASELNKPLEVVQVRVQSAMTVSFGNSCRTNSAFLHLALIGKIAPEVKAELPKKFAALLKEYGVEEKYLFLHYTETAPDAWGWL